MSPKSSSATFFDACTGWNVSLVGWEGGVNVFVVASNTSNASGFLVLLVSNNASGFKRCTVA